MKKEDDNDTHRRRLRRREAELAKKSRVYPVGAKDADISSNRLVRVVMVGDIGTRCPSMHQVRSGLGYYSADVNQN